MPQTDTPGGVEPRSVPERAPLVLAAEQQLLRDYQAEDSRAVGQHSASASGL